MDKTATEPKSRHRLGAKAARDVLFLRAVELADPRAQILSVDSRRTATKEALARSPRPERWLGKRAQALSEQLSKTHPELWHRYRARELPIRWLVATWVLAFASGLGTHALGPDRAINILAPPLVGLLAWNLAIYLWTLLRFILPARENYRPPWWQRLSPLSRGLTQQKIPSRGLTQPKIGQQPDQALEAEIGSHFLKDWLPTIKPLTAAGIGLMLHLGAIAAVLGVVVGMYARGLAFEYRATWESTFLSAAWVDKFLSTMLAPVIGILGIELPAASDIMAPSSGPAGIWIHAWALTALLGVGLPRLLLALIESARIQAMRRRLTVELPDSYVRRLEASVNTREENVQVFLYSYRPTEKTLKALRSLLLDLVGARARIQISSSIGYGDELPSAGDAGFRAVVFSAGQTPELEVHGEWLERLREDRVDGQALLIVIDESPFKKRLADDSGHRLESRRRAWRRTLDHAELPGVFLELDEPDRLDAHLEAAAAGVWPSDRVVAGEK